MCNKYVTGIVAMLFAIAIPASARAQDNSSDVTGPVPYFGYSPMHFDGKSYHAGFTGGLDWLLDSSWDLIFELGLIHTSVGTSFEAGHSIGFTATSFLGGIQYGLGGEAGAAARNSRHHVTPFVQA